MTLILCLYYWSPWQPPPPTSPLLSCVVQNVCVSVYIYKNNIASGPSIMSKVDAALSSLSGAVGGPVRLNGQSMKALLEFFDGKNALSHCTVGLFKTILQIEAAQDLFQAFIVHCYGSFL